MNKIWKDRALNKQTLTDLIYKENDFLDIIKRYPQMEKLFKIYLISIIDAAMTIKDHKYIF